MFGGEFFKIITYLQVFGWLTQFVGHGIFEQRAPAVLTNIFFMYIAPFFHTCEVMRQMFGYRDAELREFDKIAISDIIEYRSKKGLKPRKFKGIKE